MATDVKPALDLQDYTVTVEVGGRTLKTSARDGATSPQVLRDVLTILSGFLASAYASTNPRTTD